MRKRALVIPAILSVLFWNACGKEIEVGKIPVEKGKRFTGFRVVEVFRKEYDWMRWCLPLSGRFLTLELLDKGYKEYRFNLYDSAGEMIKEKRIPSGEGPNEIKVVSMDEVWLSPSGQIHFLDNDYLKSIDPETFRIETIVKLPNMIKGYGRKFTVGKHSQTLFEERNGQIITTFESTGFYADPKYYLVKSDDDFANLSVLAEFRKERPWTWRKLEERKMRSGKIISYTDYYERTRLKRIFAVDWKRGVVYLIPDIDNPEIERVGIDGRTKGRLRVDIQPEKFVVDEEEMNSWRKHVLDNSPSMIRQRMEIDSYIPEHAPTFMSMAVIEDWLIVITGNRNWRTRENEAFVFRLPDYRYEGSFFLPFPSFYQTTKFADDYYILQEYQPKIDRALLRIFQFKKD